MNGATNWRNMQGQAGEADLLAGRDFLDRFAALAVEARGAHGVGILWSKTQYGRQNVTMGFGTATFDALVALTRLGYTPRFVTEDEIAAGRAADLAALVVIGQTFAMPEKVNAGLAALVKKRRADPRRWLDHRGNRRGRELPFAQPLSKPGKPHNWGTPNMLAGENDSLLYERVHPALARAFAAALGETGHAWLKSDEGADAKVSLLQIDGGRDAAYVVAVERFLDRHAGRLASGERNAVPSKALPADSMIYDCTDERALGKAAPWSAISRRRPASSPSCPANSRPSPCRRRSRFNAGNDLVVKVEFTGAAGKRLAAVLPFHLALVRPDGKLHAEFYRSTSSEGSFSMAIPIAANVPRPVVCRGSFATQRRPGNASRAVAPAKRVVSAAPLTDRVIVRNRAGHRDDAGARAATIVLPRVRRQAAAPPPSR